MGVEKPVREIEVEPLGPIPPLEQPSTIPSPAEKPAEPAKVPA